MVLAGRVPRQRRLRRPGPDCRLPRRPGARPRISPAIRFARAASSRGSRSPTSVDLQAPSFLGADMTVELFEMGFEMPADHSRRPLPLGDQNSGAMLHEIAILPVPAGASKADVETAAAAMLAGRNERRRHHGARRDRSPGQGWAGWSGEEVAGMGVLSPQRTSWVQIALEPGTYAVVCYIPEPASRHAASHARHDRRLYRRRRLAPSLHRRHAERARQLGDQRRMHPRAELPPASA